MKLEDYWVIYILNLLTMSLWGESKTEKEAFEIIDRLLHNESTLLHIVERLLPKEPTAHKVRISLITFINKSKFSIMALNLTGTQSAQGLLGLTDTVTNVPVIATFSSVTATLDSAFATATVSSDNSITVTAVSPGTGTLTVAASVSYTDSTGAAQTQPLSTTVPVTVAQATADSVALTVTFGTPA